MLPDFGKNLSYKRECNKGQRAKRAISVLLVNYSKRARAARGCEMPEVG